MNLESYKDVCLQRAVYSYYHHQQIVRILI